MAAKQVEILVVAPGGRDTSVIFSVLASVAFQGLNCANADKLHSALSSRQPDAIVITREGLTSGVQEVLRTFLEQEPFWSNLPFIVLLPRKLLARGTHFFQSIGASRNLTLLERPLKKQVLISVLKSVVANRQRQYEVASLIKDLQSTREELVHLNQVLEEKVAERTASLRAKSRQLKEMALKLEWAQQRERERLSQVLHDELQQLLVAIKLYADRVKDGVGEKLVNFTDQAIEVTRSLTSELNPPISETTNLMDLLWWLTSRLEELHGLEINIQGPGEITTSQQVRSAALTSVRELLFNVVKHSGTREARVSVVPGESWVTIEVSDTGKGFDAERMLAQEDQQTFGLPTLKHRLEILGGNLSVKSKPSEGTRATIFIPT